MLKLGLDIAIIVHFYLHKQEFFNYCSLRLLHLEGPNIALI